MFTLKLKLYLAQSNQILNNIVLSITNILLEAGRFVIVGLLHQTQLQLWQIGFVD
jgi:hypothetical protein